MIRYWVSTFNWTGAVDVEDEIIVRTPPILRMFKGQRFRNLCDWATRCGGFQLVELPIQEKKEFQRYINV